MNVPITQLPVHTVRLLASTQVITTVSAAIKELVENALDAGARNIQIKLQNYGLDSIEVKDDGCGVSADNVQKMFLSGYTSKIRDFDDLGRLESYGFKGEALSALCRLGNVSITTIGGHDKLAMTYAINHDGVPVMSKPSHITKGSIITITNLFGNLPVRKQYLSSKRRAAEDLKRLEQIVQALSVIHPELRLTLLHNKCCIWQKNCVGVLKQSLMQVIGLRAANCMIHLNVSTNEAQLDLIIPKKDLEDMSHVFVTSSQAPFVHINKRPIHYKEVTKLVTQHVTSYFQDVEPTKTPLYLVALTVPPEDIDVNLEPNKTRVLLKKKDSILSFVDKTLSEFYSQGGHFERDTSSADLSDDDDHQVKRLRLTSPVRVPAVEESLNQVPAVDDIHLESEVELTVEAESICSQINRENCVLTSEKEVSQLNDLFSSGATTLVTKICSDRYQDTPTCPTSRASDDVQQDVGGDEADIQKDRGVVCREFKMSTKLRTSVGNVSQGCCEEEQFDAETNGNLVEESTTLTEDELSKVLDMDVGGEVQGWPNCSSIQEVQNDGLDDSGVPGGAMQTDTMLWSKGHLMTREGESLSGGAAVLVRGAGCVEENAETVTERRVECDAGQFDLSLQSVSSQMGRKELSAFTKFTRIMRPKSTTISSGQRWFIRDLLMIVSVYVSVLEEFPNIMFTKVAGLLVDRWKDLSEDEKRHYEKVAAVVDVQRKQHKEDIARKAKPVETDRLKKMMAKIRERSVKRPVRRCVELTASLERVKALRVSAPYCQTPGVFLLGQLSPSGNWLFLQDEVVGHVRHVGLQELVLSSRMSAGHSVPRRPLDSPVVLTEGVLGQGPWETLLSLPRELDYSSHRATITSDVVVKNGLEVQFQELVGGTSALLTQVSSVIPCHGVAELKDALHRYYATGEHAGLAAWRPASVSNYISNEAIRISQENPHTGDRAYLQELLDTWQLCLQHVAPVCLHGKDIFITLYTLPACSHDPATS